MVKKLSFFEVFEDRVVYHIIHEHSDVMKQKSVIVSVCIVNVHKMLGRAGCSVIMYLLLQYILYYCRSHWA